MVLPFNAAASSSTSLMSLLSLNPRPQETMISASSTFTSSVTFSEIFVIVDVDFLGDIAILSMFPFLELSALIGSKTFDGMVIIAGDELNC